MEKEEISKYDENEDIMEQLTDTSQLTDAKVEDVIAKGIAIADRVRASQSEPAIPTAEELSPPSSEQKDAPFSPPQVPHVKEKQKEKGKKKMMSRLPALLSDTHLASSAPEPTAEEEQTLPEEPTASRQEPGNKTPVPSSGPEKHTEEGWEEDFETEEVGPVFPDDEEGAMYGTHDPSLSIASTHLTDLKDEFSSQFSSLRKVIEKMQADTNAANTALADRIRALERKQEHDPAQYNKASSVPSFSAGEEATVHAEKKEEKLNQDAPRISFAERLRRQKLSAGEQ